MEKTKAMEKFEEIEPETERIIIGIGYENDQGKDLFANMLAILMGINKVNIASCADELKAIYAEQEGMTLEALEDRKKHEDSEVRTGLNKLAMKKKKKHGNNYWINQLLRREDLTESILIIPDIRFKAEIEKCDIAVMLTGRPNKGIEYTDLTEKDFGIVLNTAPTENNSTNILSLMILAKQFVEFLEGNENETF